MQSGSVAADDVAALGAYALAALATALRQCAEAGHIPPDDDPPAAATVLWVGLHGLAHQRLVAPGYPWPPVVQDRLVTMLTGLPIDGRRDAAKSALPGELCDRLGGS